MESNFYSRMKHLFLAMLILLGSVGLTDAQHMNYDNDSGWKLGFNMGGTWQQSDMKARAGIGFGATL
jgi:hypothetical protein